MLQRTTSVTRLTVQGREAKWTAVGNQLQTSTFLYASFSSCLNSLIILLASCFTII